MPCSLARAMSCWRRAGRERAASGGRIPPNESGRPTNQRWPPRGRSPALYHVINRLPQCIGGACPVYGQRLVGQPKELNHGRGLFDYTKWFGMLAVLFCDSSTPEPTRVSPLGSARPPACAVPAVRLLMVPSILVGRPLLNQGSAQRNHNGIRHDQHAMDRDIPNRHIGLRKDLAA
jgi:hypothetical protein